MASPSPHRDGFLRYYDHDCGSVDSCDSQFILSHHQSYNHQSASSSSHVSYDQEEEFKLLFKSKIQLQENAVRKAVARCVTGARMVKITVFKSGNTALLECENRETFQGIFEQIGSLKKIIAPDLKIERYEENHKMKRSSSLNNQKIDDSDEDQSSDGELTSFEVVAKNVPVDINVEEIYRAIGDVDIIDARVSRIYSERNDQPTKCVKIECQYVDDARWLLDNGFVLQALTIYCERPKVEVKRCLRCQRPGHDQRRCEFELACKRCGGRHHHNDCTSARPRCVNCGGDHQASFPHCPALVDYARPIEEDRRLQWHAKECEQRINELKVDLTQFRSFQTIFKWQSSS